MLQHCVPGGSSLLSEQVEAAPSMHAYITHTAHLFQCTENWAVLITPDGIWLMDAVHSMHACAGGWLAGWRPCRYPTHNLCDINHLTSASASLASGGLSGGSVSTKAWSDGSTRSCLRMHAPHHRHHTITRMCMAACAPLV